MQTDNRKLTEAAEAYSKDGSDINFVTVLALLKKCNTWVPMTETENGVLPYILETEDGMQFYPAFSEESQVPDEYAQSLLWTQVPFEATAEYVMASTEVSGILLNAFTSSTVIGEDAIRVLMKKNTQEHVVNESDLKLSLCEDGGEAAEIKRRAYAFFYDRKDVKKAYFAKLQNGGEMSYIFIVDAAGDTQSMFADLFATIGKSDISMPIDYTLFPSLKEQIEEIGCQPFFIA